MNQYYQAEILTDLRSEDLQVIGQSAQREIIFFFHTKSRKIICFDQHAVDERIRFEKLLDDISMRDEDLDRLKTRACRGAIRFGDKLGLEACRILIRRLLRCKVPFKCAHSRCSVKVLDSIDEILHLERTMNKSRKLKNK